MSNVETLVENEHTSIIAELELALDRIIINRVENYCVSYLKGKGALGLVNGHEVDERIQAALEKINALSEDDVKELVQSEVKNELDISEIPDLYGVRDIVQEELDNVEWADRFDVGGAVDEALGEDYVKRDELDSALDELSISRG